MSVRRRLALTTGLMVVAAILLVELVVFADLLGAEQDDPLMFRLLVERGVPALVAGLAAGTLAAVVAAWLVGERVLRPFTSIVNLAARIADEGDFSRRVAEDSADPEVARLTRTFNGLVARVDRLLAEQRELLADTSHELRTPLTTVRGNLDLLDRLPPGEEHGEVVAEARQEVDRMARLVRELLLLAESDEEGRQEQQPVRLDVLAASAARRVAGEAEAHRVTMDAEPVVVHGDEDRLRQLVSNLVSNALRHATQGPGAVQVRVRRRPPQALLEVEDDGPGIPPEALERVFDRFYRLDRGRSRAEGGTGLGLSIVRHVAESHGGRTWAENVEGRGARFSVLLPAEPSWALPPEGQETLPVAVARDEAAPRPTTRT